MLFPPLLTAAAPLECPLRAVIAAATGRSGRAISGRPGPGSDRESTPQSPLLLSPLPRAAVEAQSGRIGRRRRRSAPPLFSHGERRKKGPFSPKPPPFPLIQKRNPPLLAIFAKETLSFILF